MGVATPYCCFCKVTRANPLKLSPLTVTVRNMSKTGNDARSGNRRLDLLIAAALASDDTSGDTVVPPDLPSVGRADPGKSINLRELDATLQRDADSAVRRAEKRYGEGLTTYIDRETYHLLAPESVTRLARRSLATLCSAGREAAMDPRDILPQLLGIAKKEGIAFLRQQGPQADLGEPHALDLDGGLRDLPSVSCRTEFGAVEPETLREAALDVIEAISPRQRLLTWLFVEEVSRSKHLSYVSLTAALSGITRKEETVAAVKKDWESIRARVWQEVLNNLHDRKRGPFEALLAASLRAETEPDDEELTPEIVPELGQDEAGILEALGPNFVEALLGGDWIAKRLRSAVGERDRIGTQDAIADLLREHGGKALALLQILLPPELRAVDRKAVLKRALVTACRHVDTYDSSTERLQLWFMKIVFREAVQWLRGAISHGGSTSSGTVTSRAGVEQQAVVEKKVLVSQAANGGVVINEAVLIRVIEVGVNRVKLGIDAPMTVPVHRGEFYQPGSRVGCCSAEN